MGVFITAKAGKLDLDDERANGMVITAIRETAPWWLRIFGVSRRVADGYCADRDGKVFMTFTGLAID